MAKQKPLIINAPREGISASPHTGYGDVRNLDIFSIPGVVKLNNILQKKSSTTVDAQVKWIVKNPASPANLYAVDSNGVVYTSANSGDTWSELADRGGAGEGLIVWKDYLILATTTGLDCYGPLSGSPSWDTGWQTIDTGTWHPMLVSKLDGKIYGGAGRYVFTIEELTNFDPDTGATFTFTQQHLDLPEDYKVKCLAELGNNILIGTWQGTNIYDVKVADIFSWDGTSTTYGQPIIMNENGVHAMLTIGNSVYILAGIEGAVYKSNGVSAWQIAEVPLSVADISNGKYIEPYPGALINFKGRPFFGVSSADVADGMGIYSLSETTRGTILNYEHSISTETMGSANPLVIGALLGITRDQLVVGWRDHATYGIDLINTASYLYTTAYTKAYFDSPLYLVGTTLQLRQFPQIELLLAKELATGEGIQVKYRVNLTDTWTTLRTYIYSGSQAGTNKVIGGVTSDNDTANIPASDTLQIRTELLGTSTTSPEFLSLTLK